VVPGSGILSLHCVFGRFLVESSRAGEDIDDVRIEHR
jgi:hypothetical protein